MLPTLLPKSAKPRPAVICQHGLGGRPEILAGLNNELEGGWVYDRFAERLVEKGYVVYVPFMNWGHAPTRRVMCWSNMLTPWAWLPIALKWPN